MTHGIERVAPSLGVGEVAHGSSTMVVMHKVVLKQTQEGGPVEGDNNMCWQQIPQWAASRLSLLRIAQLIPLDQHTCTKVIDLRCQTKCAHKVRLQTPLGPEVVHLVALVVQSIETVDTCYQQEGEIHAREDMPMEDTVLEEVDKLLEEEGMVSSSTLLAVDNEDPIQIQSKRVESSGTFSFTAKTKLFLTELQAMEHSTRDVMK